MALIVHRYKDIQIEAPWANRAQLDRILHDPVLLREQLDLVRRFQRQAFISFIDGVHHVQRLLARVVLNSSSSAVVPAFFRWLPERACTSTGACAEVATASGACPLIQT